MIQEWIPSAIFWIFQFFPLNIHEQAAGFDGTSAALSSA